jgi:RimJ/RimL family protein N-acetyltransferase
MLINEIGGVWKEAKDFAAMYQARIDKAGDFMWVMIDNHTGEGIGFYHYLDVAMAHRKVEIGVWVAAKGRRTKANQVLLLISFHLPL